MRNWTKGWRMLLWCVLVCVHVMSIAQVYTWTDKDGRKHFGDPATTPEDKRDLPVHVPPPNVADRFIPNPVNNGADVGGDATQGSPPVSIAPSGAPKKPAFNDRSGCQAARQAYDASLACYAECGKTSCRGGLAQGGRGSSSCGRNNAACGHCQELPMPRC